MQMKSYARFGAMIATSTAVMFGSAAVFAVALWLVRSQETVEDVSYKGLISDLQRAGTH